MGISVLRLIKYLRVSIVSVSSILITQLVAAKILPSIFKSYQKSDIGKSLDNIVYLPQVRDFFRVKLINTSIEQLAGSFDFMLLDYFAKDSIISFVGQ